MKKKPTGSLRDLVYSTDPRMRRLLVNEALETAKMTWGQIVDLVFEDCLSDEDFARRAVEWNDALNQGGKPEELKNAAMKRRRLIR